MKSKLVQIGLMALAAGVLTACGGGGSSPAALPVLQPVGNVAVAVAAAGFTGGVSNATPTVNPKMVFQLVGPTPIEVGGKPVINFTVVDSQGGFVKGLKLTGGDAACSGSNISFTMAKYDGSNWWSLISRQRYMTDDVAANHYAVVEATTDPAASAKLEEKTAESFYTYSFATDVVTAKAIADTSTIANNGQIAESNGKTIHRVALQLCYVDPVSQATVKVNPYMDFTLSGTVGTPVKDNQGVFTDAKKVVDRASCNECHGDFAVHRNGGRIDPNYCVVCHNAGSKDYNTGNPIDFKLMVHKLHMGKRLKQVTPPYKVATVVANDIIYPQNQKNCVVCHDGSATAKHKTAQGDNWRYTASKNACFACHDDYKSGNWKTLHTFNRTINGLYPNDPDASIDSVCASCHNDAAVGGVSSDGTAHAVNTSAAHAVPQWKLGENFQLNILSTTLNPAAGGKRSVTVRYSVSNPKTGDVYDLETLATTADISRLALLFSWHSTDYDHTPTSVAAISGSKVSGVSAYELTSELPDTATGTGVVAFQGRISMTLANALKLMPDMPLRERNATTFTVPVKNVVSYYAISDSSPMPRRMVVSADKCNSCHGKLLGFSVLTDSTRSKAGDPGWGGHGGSRNDPQVCVICHTGNLLLNDNTTSANFKVLIHDLHKELGTAYPVWPSTSTATGIMKGVPSGTKNCAMCHEGNSYKSDKSVQGTKDLSAAILAMTGYQTNGIISPKASTCYSCHSSKTDATKNQLVIDHMVNDGGAQFGTVTQANLDVRLELCDRCHSPGSSVAPVDKMHGQ